jgi:hypothetical protein
MTPQLYTFIVEYKGGTYVSQIRSSNPPMAVSDWPRLLPEQELSQWDLDRDQLVGIITAGDAVPLRDRIGVWCLTGVDDADEQLLINIVRTDDSH